MQIIKYNKNTIIKDALTFYYKTMNFIAVLKINNKLVDTYDSKEKNTGYWNFVI